MKRKSPIKHQVHSHRRAGVAVHTYVRGHGKHQNKLASLHHTPGKVSSFTVRIKYVNDSESLPINSISYPEAISTAMLIRRLNEVPVEVEARIN